MNSLVPVIAAAVVFIFGYRFLSGTAESMRDPSTALISRSTAMALYGTENAVGKTFQYENRRLGFLCNFFSGIAFYRLLRCVVF